MNYYAVVFLLRAPNLLRRRPFFERENVCNSQENGVRARRAAIVNHPAVLKILRVVNLLRVVFLVRRGPLGRSAGYPASKLTLWAAFSCLICGSPMLWCFARSVWETDLLPLLVLTSIAGAVPVKNQYHSPRNFYKLIPLQVFFCNFFCNFYGNSLRPPIFSVTLMRSSGSRVDWKNIFL